MTGQDDHRDDDARRSADDPEHPEDRSSGSEDDSGLSADEAEAATEEAGNAAGSESGADISIDPTAGSGIPDDVARFLEEDVQAADDETLPKNVVRILDDESRFTGDDPRILIACMGNILRGDDGFGVAVAEELEQHDLPPNVEVAEVGISGVSMAQDMMSGYDAMVLVDAMVGGEDPGTVYVERAEVPDLDQYGKREIGSFAADMHQTDPSKVLILGQALDVLPEPTIFVGCEPLDADHLEDSMSEPVREAVPQAVEYIETIVEEVREMEFDEAASDD